jgi:hypothetical protein
MGGRRLVVWLRLIARLPAQVGVTMAMNRSVYDTVIVGYRGSGFDGRRFGGPASDGGD